MKHLKNVNFGLAVGAWTLLIVGILRALLGGIYDPDLWWHLASGREIIDNQSFIREEIFSHTLPGTPWINFEWLSQVFFTLVTNCIDLWGLFWVKVLLCLLIVALMASITHFSGARGPWLLLLTYWGFKILQPRLLARPELFTLIMMGLFVALFYLLQAERLPFRTQFLPWVFFGLMVAWCNFHGGFIYGVGIVVLMNIGARWAKSKNSLIHVLDQSVFMVCVATLVNPAGFKLHSILVEHIFQLKENKTLIQEWQVNRLVDLPYFWALFAAVLFIVFKSLKSRNLKVRFWSPLAIVFCLYGATIYRHSALLAFIGIPLMSIIVIPRKFTTLAWILCFIPGIVMAHGQKDFFPLHPVRSYAIPKQACEFLKSNNISGNIFNSYGYGGYISWFFGKEQKIFFDGRYIFQPLLVEVDNLNKGLAQGISNSQWPAFLQKYNVDHALINYSDGKLVYPKDDIPFHLTPINAQFPRDKWALVYWDDSAMIFLKRVQKFKDVIEKYEYLFARPFNLDQMKYIIDERLIPIARLNQELDRNQKESGSSLKQQMIRNLLPR